MKTISRVTFLVLMLFAFTVAANAQHEHKMKCPMQKHCSHDSDSTENTGCDHDFFCMPDFNSNDFPFTKNKKKFNGHWAGVELGINGYLTPDFDMNFYPQYPYMNMNTARSLVVNLNPFEFNVNLYKNHIGFTTGLGFQLSNYYFTDTYVMLKDSTSLVAYKSLDQLGNTAGMRVNKMFVSYINLPLLFEYQTNARQKLSSFHATLGVIVGVRIGSYTKQSYESINQTYSLVDDNGNKVASYYVDKTEVRTRGAYHLAPFKLDAAFRVGWSHLNLFATYSLTQMFQKNQGPELYPWTVGITLLGW
jgi:hypothetical protein